MIRNERVKELLITMLLCRAVKGPDLVSASPLPSMRLVGLARRDWTAMARAAAAYDGGVGELGWLALD